MKLSTKSRVYGDLCLLLGVGCFVFATIVAVTDTSSNHNLAIITFMGGVAYFLLGVFYHSHADKQARTEWRTINPKELR